MSMMCFVNHVVCPATSAKLWSYSTIDQSICWQSDELHGSIAMMAHRDHFHCILAFHLNDGISILDPEVLFCSEGSIPCRPEISSIYLNFSLINYGISEFTFPHSTAHFNPVLPHWNHYHTNLVKSNIYIQGHSLDRCALVLIFSPPTALPPTSPRNPLLPPQS